MADLVFFAAVVVVAAILWQSRAGGRRARRARERLADATGWEEEPAAEEVPEERRRIRSALRRRPWLAPAVGAAIAGALFLLFDVHLSISIAAGFLLGVLASMLEELLGNRQANAIQAQLADAVDLIIASLRSGAGVMDSLQEAARESTRPIRPYLEEVVTRLRLGDDPRHALEDLARAVPLETFRLFALTLAVHWELGGSLAATLSGVGRTVRDRIELSRRIRSQSTEAQFSTVAILGITYALGALMWTSNPERMGEFLDSALGSQIIAAVVILQGVGLVWMGRLARMPAFS